ncbi:hypothetical protein F8388_012592 [Cannabis sativa]|uniref:Transposase Tnp1/En/Spm-like domain-containing protein n=1 Tax=Cannabis sativa TaxID=3483 RepID=A0A7J6HCM2_CANSA|nr:hypothetical protein F8388_012592 [Cannabis sativa]KAF4398237.1 hypothetical protein G4B88_009853 [Cannabis sativa]
MTKRNENNIDHKNLRTCTKLVSTLITIIYHSMDQHMRYRLAEHDEDCVESFTDLLIVNNGKKNTRVRDGKNAPINYKSWHKVPDKYKDRMWKIIQKRSATNKASRSKKKYNHTTGTKFFAQIRDAQKKNGGSAPTRADMFKICYTNKDKSVTDTTKEVMALNYNRDVTSSQFVKQKSRVHHITRNSTPIVVGEMVNLKSVAADPETIAIGLIVSKDSSKEVGGKELGDHYSDIVVQVCIKPDEELIRPCGQYKTIGEVVGVPIAWPTTFLVSRKLDKQLHDSMMFCISIFVH